MSGVIWDPKVWQSWVLKTWAGRERRHLKIHQGEGHKRLRPETQANTHKGGLAESHPPPFHVPRLRPVGQKEGAEAGGRESLDPAPKPWPLRWPQGRQECQPRDPLSLQHGLASGSLPFAVLRAWAR